jgi:large subunit ribosomal protein L14
METQLIVTDNSGAKRAKCIKVLGGSNHMITKVGDVIVVSILSVNPGSKIKKGDVTKALIVRTKSKIVRQDGSFIKFEDNAVVLLTKEREMLGSRIFGPVAREVRQNEFFKIASLASEVL